MSSKMRLETANLGTLAKNVGIPIEGISMSLFDSLQSFQPSDDAVKWFSVIMGSAHRKKGIPYSTLHRAYMEFRDEFCRHYGISQDYDIDAGLQINPLILSVIFGENNLDVIAKGREMIARDNTDIDLEKRALSDEMRAHEGLAVKGIAELMVSGQMPEEQYMPLVLGIIRRYDQNRESAKRDRILGHKRRPTGRLFMVDAEESGTQDIIRLDLGSAVEVGRVNGTYHPSDAFGYIYEFTGHTPIADRIVEAARRQIQPDSRINGGHGLSGGRSHIYGFEYGAQKEPGNK